MVASVKKRGIVGKGADDDHPRAGCTGRWEMCHNPLGAARSSHLPRGTTIQHLGDEEGPAKKIEPPNRHVYKVAREARVSGCSPLRSDPDRLPFFY
jgi:hypothetical protein